MAEHIEREAAYSDFEKCNAENQKWTPSRVKALIARQPAADVAPVRHGRWVYPIGMAWNYVCSECGKSIGVIKHNYCPNCGCKMLEDCDGEK